MHIGGWQVRSSWLIFDASDEKGRVDIVGNAKDLSQFEAARFESVYASHVLEHFALSEIPVVLREWRRVLKPGGKLHISVPDLSVLCALYGDPDRTTAERLRIQRMIYGAQLDQWDFHKVGFTAETLTSALQNVDSGPATSRWCPRLTYSRTRVHWLYTARPLASTLLPPIINKPFFSFLPFVAAERDSSD